MKKEKWRDEAGELIKKHEGLRLKIYRCPANKISIGFGRNLEDNGISKACAEFMFNEDFTNCIKKAEGVFGKTFFNSLPGDAKKVIIDMIFNLGGSRFETFKKMIKYVKEKDFRNAGKEILNSKAYTQNKRRYKELSDLMIGVANA